MLTMLNYFRVRYMSEKAQGIVEYALVIAFVVAIGAVLVKTGEGSLTAGIQKIFTNLTTIVSGGASNADTAVSGISGKK